eukprot:117914_1
MNTSTIIVGPYITNLISTNKHANFSTTMMTSANTDNKTILGIEMSVFYIIVIGSTCLIIALLCIIIICLLKARVYITSTSTFHPTIGMTAEIKISGMVKAESHSNDSDSEVIITIKTSKGSEDGFAAKEHLEAPTDREIAQSLDIEDMFIERNTETDDIKMGEGYIDDRFYKGIERILKKCDSDEWEQYLDNFKKHKVTDVRLKLINDDDEIWNILIPEYGVRIEFKQYIFN